MIGTVVNCMDVRIEVQLCSHSSWYKVLDYGKSIGPVVR